MGFFENAISELESGADFGTMKENYERVYNF